MNNTFGLICENLSTTPLTPKSGEQEDQMAPIEVVAMKASTVSIVLGKYAAILFFFLMIRRPPRSTQSRSSAASDVYKRQLFHYKNIYL